MLLLLFLRRSFAAVRSVGPASGEADHPDRQGRGHQRVLSASWMEPADVEDGHKDATPLHCNNEAQGH